MYKRKYKRCISASISGVNIVGDVLVFDVNGANIVSDVLVFDLNGDPVSKLGRFTKVDINLACARKQEYQFLLSPSAVEIIKDFLKDNAKDNSKDNLKDNAKQNLKDSDKDFIKDKLLKVSARFYLNDKKRQVVNLKLAGDLDLLCQRCGEGLLWPVLVDEEYFLMNEYSVHRDKLEQLQGMEVLCERGRVDLVSLAAQEVGLVVDMVPKHQVCP